ncbi:hypothetical protein [Arenivirga flava]|uniref:Uncharacterized protein n=1 Tax=Arenivirga flava TaxID=1930060 RepID=A0AA37XCR5_9MICO|nr:hypothetical protein [Arenivirga flava]GMA28712.1 hypothetical protein GCM10025874_19650 [Arenivirga flava]
MKPPRLNVIADPPIVRVAALLHRLERGFPELSRQRILDIVLAEHDAITGGTPVAVPQAVEAAAVESLQRRRSAARDAD